MSEALQKRARHRWRLVTKMRDDPRFKRALKCFTSAGLLSANTPVSSSRGSARLEDVLFAGTIEPRFLELLPAVYLKRPGILKWPKALPEDLQHTVQALRHGVSGPDFRGVPFDSCGQWLSRMGHRNKAPTVTKSFRLRQEDLARLRRLKSLHPDASETDLWRLGLAALEREEPSSTG